MTATKLTIADKRDIISDITEYYLTLENILFHAMCFDEETGDFDTELLPITPPNLALTIDETDGYPTGSIELRGIEGYADTGDDVIWGEQLEDLIDYYDDSEPEKWVPALLRIATLMLSNADFADAGRSIIQFIAFEPDYEELPFTDLRAELDFYSDGYQYEGDVDYDDIGESVYYDEETGETIELGDPHYDWTEEELEELD